MRIVDESGGRRAAVPAVAAAAIHRATRTGNGRNDIGCKVYPADSVVILIGYINIPARIERNCKRVGKQGEGRRPSVTTKSDH